MITLKIEGMTCMGCVQSVERAVLKADPNAKVTIDLASGRLDLDGSLDRDAARKVVEATGFDVVD